MAIRSFSKYVRKAVKKLAQLEKAQGLRPVVIEGSVIARTWWGKAWNKNLESYADYTNRIGGGRSDVRSRAVLDLQVSAGEVKALVQGSRAKPYAITITIKKLVTLGTLLLIDIFLDSAPFFNIISKCRVKPDSMYQAPCTTLWFGA